MLSSTLVKIHILRIICKYEQTSASLYLAVRVPQVLAQVRVKRTMLTFQTGAYTARTS